MADKETLSTNVQSQAERPAAEAEAPRKPRRHGYRGYPLSKEAGGVHWGRGFSGIEPPGTGGVTLPRAGILTEESTRRTKS
jgi:hypothetical protein